MSLLLESVSQGQLHESINRLKVLIVEEISMVESQFLERLNLFMQHIVGNKRPFGGKQVIFLGDFHQLPPVKPFENCLHCGEPLANTRIEPVCKYAECINNGVSFKLGDKWAFKAPVWAQLKLKHVKLEQIHRQKDAGFQDMLNKIRNGVLLSAVEWSALKTRKKPPNGAFPVRLMSLRNRVNQFNESQLASIKSEAKSWNAKDSSTKLSFSEFDKTYLGSQEVARKLEEYKRGLEHSRFPTKLTLKVGAKVVLLSNLNPEGGLVNGSQGEVVRFVNTNGWKKEEVKGRRAERLAARIDEFQKSQDFWCPVVRFANGRTRTIFPVPEESLRGPHNDRYQACRVQIPLALAWALTIHKSQGMTLNYVEVSSQDIFEPGQMYVGFSRATTIEGLTVTGDSMHQMKMDQDILKFYEKTKWEDLSSSNVARPRAPRKKKVKAVEEPALMCPSQSQETQVDVEDQDVSVPLSQGPEFIEILDSE
jgi:ATP-dependent DNA helicase PIF1